MRHLYICYCLMLMIPCMGMAQFAGIEDDLSMYYDNHESVSSDTTFTPINSNDASWPSSTCFDGMDVKYRIGHYDGSKQNQIYFIVDDPSFISYTTPYHYSYFKFKIHYTDGTIEQKLSDAQIFTTHLWQHNFNRYYFRVAFDDTKTVDKFFLGIADKGLDCVLENDLCNEVEASYVNLTQLIPNTCVPTCEFQNQTTDNSCSVNISLMATRDQDNIELSLNGNDLLSIKNNAQSENISRIELVINGYSADYSQHKISTVKVYADGDNINYTWEETLYGWEDITQLFVKTVVYDLQSNPIECNNEIELPLSNDNEVCSILDLLQYHGPSANNIVFDFSNPGNVNYLIDELQQLNMTYNQAEQLFHSSIDQLFLTFHYDYGDGVQLAKEQIVDNVGQIPLDQLFFNFSDIDTVNLSGHLQLDFIAPDGTSDFCMYTPVEFEDDYDPNEGELPTYECEDPYTIPTVSNQTPIQEIRNGDILNISNFYFRVTDANYSNGILNGLGEMSIPFKDEPLSIELRGLQVNEEYKVYAGEVKSVSHDPNFAQSMNVANLPLNIGGEICQEVPLEGYDENGVNQATGLTDRGFGLDSINTLTGTKYDPKGFDIDGNHVDTDGPYDSNGCDMFGNDKDGNPCPINADLEFVQEFVGSVIDDLDKTTNETISEIVTGLDEEIDLLDCQEFRDQMNTHISALNFDREYIVGSSNEYLEYRMSDKFTAEPKPMILNTGIRDQGVIDLEKDHIELYECDKKIVKFNSLKEMIEAVDREQLDGDLEIALNELTRFQVEAFQADPDKYLEWLTVTIIRLIESYNGLSNIDFEKSETFFSFTPMSSYGLSSYNVLVNEVFKSQKSSINKKVSNYFSTRIPPPGGALTTPLKLTQDREGTAYDIYLDQVRITAAGAFLDAYFKFEDPHSKKILMFKGLGLSFGTGGMLDNAKLSLATEVEIRLSNAAMLRIFPSADTYVDFDCSGFKSIGIDGAVEICREIVLPVDPITKDVIADPARVNFLFKIQANSFSELYLALNDGQEFGFAMPGYEEYVFTANNIHIDFSDYRSPEAVTMPIGYTSPYYTGNSFDPAWRGLYIGDLSVTFPNSFSSSGVPITAGISNFVIDDSGVSGLVFAEDIVSINDGNLGGWPFSIENINLLILKNNIKGGGLDGAVKVPVLEGPMQYTADIIGDGGFIMTVQPTQDERMDMMLADVVLKPSSFVEVSYQNDTVYALASLNGVANFNKDGNSSINIPEITFNEFEVSNQSPYFSAGTWEFPNSVGAKFAGFGLNLNGITPISPNETEAGISFGVDLTLVDAIKINAGGAFDILGKLEVDNLGRQDWNFDRVDVKGFSIDTKFSAGHFKGSLLKFDNVPVFGEGFHAFIDAEFKSLGSMQAYALFGRTPDQVQDGYKYFFVDALANLGAAIPAGPLSINGFAGGVSYAMSKNVTDLNLQNGQNTSLPDIGTSLSGIQYTPDSGRGLGFRAGALLGLAGNTKLFNGHVEFEMNFNSEENGGGLAEIAMNGKGQFMSTKLISGDVPSEAGNSKPNGIDASLAAYVNLTLNFDREEFSGSFKAFLNTPGGIIKGSGAGGLMVTAEAHFDPNKWYVNVGNPTQRCGIDIGIPSLGSIEMRSYLNVGTEIPPFPGLPANVKKLASKVKSNESLRGSGGGFMFGAKIDAEASLDVGIASGQINAGLGFDLMLRKFENTYCANNDNNGEIGIGGWYAMGQMWAYLEGKISILGINVLSAGIAAVLQAQLPNPFFAQATVGVRIKTFLKTFKKSMAISFGDVCQVIGSGDDGFEIEAIAYLTPMDNTKDVPVDINPQILLNVPIGLELEVASLSGNTNIVYEAKLDAIELKGETRNYEFTYQLVDDGRRIAIKPHELFVGGDSITLSATVNILKDGALHDTEVKFVGFKVGEGYTEVIPESNVMHSYPQNGMVNFYKDEYNLNEGFIQLNKGMPEIFFGMESDEQITGVFTKSMGEPVVVNIRYDYIENRIVFPFPENYLENESAYKFELIKQGGIPFAEGQNSDLERVMGNPSDFKQNEESGEQSGQKSNKALYTLYFRVSKYNTFIDKVIAFEDTPENSSRMIKSLDDEPFDQLEIDGTENTDPLISVSVDSDQFYPWIDAFNKNIYNNTFPVLIETPLSESVVCSRISPVRSGSALIHPLDAFGMPFADAIEGLEIGENEYVNITSVNSTLSSATQSVRIETAAVAGSHFFKLKDAILMCRDELTDNGIADFPPRTRTKPLEWVYNNSNPPMPAKDYIMNLKYTLPGGIRTSEFNLIFTK